MPIDVETGCRIALGAMVAGTVIVGVPQRLRADRAGGRVSVRTDPWWFWCGMAVIGPPVLLGSMAFLAGARGFDFARVALPDIARLGGVSLGAGGLALFAWMFHHLGTNVTSTAMPRREATLVTSGPYRWVRHPMYTAALLMGIAAALLTANLVVAIGGFAMFGLLAARSRLEERRLEEKFGAAYRAYQRRTGRFLPRWRGPPPEAR